MPAEPHESPEEPPEAAEAAEGRLRQPPLVPTEALHALAHPLRVRMYDELSSRGPATASDLARRLGESTGATSYHLRQLARHGFIEEDPTRGTLRERYWRARPGSQRFADPQLMREAPPATREAARLVFGEWNRGRAERVEHWRDTMHTWPLAWAEASLDLTGHLKLTATELEEFNADLRQLTGRWSDRVRGTDGASADRTEDGEERYDVELQIHAFPLDPPRRYEGGLTSDPGLTPYAAPAAPAPPPEPLPPPPAPFPPAPAPRPDRPDRP